MDNYPSSSNASSSTGAGSSSDDVSNCAPSTSSGRKRSSSTGEPQRKRIRSGDCRRLWHPEWEVNYLVEYDKKSDTCTCLKCDKKIETVKKYSLQRHLESTHPETKDWSIGKKKLFVEKAKQKNKQMQASLIQAFVPSKLPQLASYKLGFTLAKHHKPLAFGEAVVEWAAASDPNSKIFKAMPKSRQTLTRRVSQIANFIQTQTKNGVQMSPGWAIQMDESTDKGDHAQAILYVRFVDFESCSILTKFLTILRVEGNPNAANLFGVLNAFVETEGLPKQKLVCFSSDGASVMRSEGRGVSGHLRRNYNPSIFTQHCIVHRQVLAAKDGLDKLPATVHKTVDEVMKHFKNSHVRKEKLKELIEMSEDGHDYQQLVQYHKVRWLSLSDCVKRFTDLISEIVQYFEHEAQNTALRVSERNKLQEYHDEVVNRVFQLYLYFLQGRLPLLANINTQLQKSEHDLFTAYQKIASFKNAFLEPILTNVSMGMQEGNIRTDVDNIDYQCRQFEQFKDQSLSHGLLTPAQLHEIMKNVFDFTYTIGKSLEARFPEMEFVLQNLSFLCPENRKHCSRCDIEAVVMRYCKDMVNASTASMQFSVYRNDDSLDFLILNCDKRPDTFFCKIAQMSEYDQFGLLALLLLCMCPDTIAYKQYCN